jgi:hypothetical protein
MQNQIKVDKNRKGILFSLDFGPLICGAPQSKGKPLDSKELHHAFSRPVNAMVGLSRFAAEFF